MSKKKKPCRFCGKAARHFTPAEMCDGMYAALLDAMRAAHERAYAKISRT